jgi:hypothetical protein
VGVVQALAWICVSKNPPYGASANQKIRAGGVLDRTTGAGATGV